MRVFLIISKNGDAWDLARRITSEGHRAIVYINDLGKRRVGNGIVEKSATQEELISSEGAIDSNVLKKVLYPKPDCIIFDMVGEGFGRLADRLKKDFPVIGGSLWGDKVELDRPYGHKVMKTMGINTPITYRFTDYKKAVDFVEEKNLPFVYKPSGNQATSSTYVAQNADDLIGILEYYSDTIKEEFELQEKVEGIEVSTELWFNGKEVLNVNHTMEEKSLLEGGLGPKAGCMGSVVWLGVAGSRLYKEGVGKLLPALRKIGYRGAVDLNTIVTKDKLYGLEFTARFGYDALFILLEMYRGRVNDLLYGVATGLQRRMDFRANLGLGIDLSVPPYPMDIEPDLYLDVLIQGLNASNLRHIWLYDVYKKGDRWLAAGNGGDIGTVTARGDSIGDWKPIRDAKRRVFRTISNLIIPDLMYRRDIGDRMERDHKQLVKWGWL